MATSIRVCAGLNLPVGFASLQAQPRTSSITLISTTSADANPGAAPAAAAVLIDTLHAALEDAVEALNRVRVDLASAILADAVPHEIMLGEVLIQVGILAS